ncbi:protein CHLOROPLAST IMPORT APPARATUS 2-like [Salvia hispanica]|uniref:protein CHLOROPLAST IMPORT APPARATUS 2-like n=1 Tax=Salvia hispanica TaxID=49212 RepID=UPI002009557A|nr:protein CHLOROPLAST IMPORT APPARATUS 2-like [Salvia hispanica]
MSSCLSGRAYRLNLDLIKSPTTTFSTSNSSSSPSSTLSESSNSPLSIFTRKPRTPRKRPNQTYNEAAAILSTAYPKLFPAKNIPRPPFNARGNNFLSEPPDLLLPAAPPPPAKFEKACRSPGEVTSSPRGDFFPENRDEFGEDFDAESILDEEVEGGIDSIMGNLAAEGGAAAVEFAGAGAGGGYCYGFPVGMGFDFGYGMMMRAMRNGGGRERWSSPTVNVVDITAAAAGEKKAAAATKKKQKKKREDYSAAENSGAAVGRLGLNLNYDDVLSAWSEKGSPFSGDAAAAEGGGKDVQERLGEIDLFPENGAPARGAIVLRYKEKRRTRLFSKKIRYQVRKANADQRPRIKGRFVRTPNSAEED